MIEQHLSEETLQNFALGENLSEAEVAHIRHCIKCHTAISAYQLLFAKIKEQEKARFDFSVSELVSTHLQPEAGKPVLEKWLVYLSIASVIILLTETAYVFAGSISSLFVGVSKTLLYLVLVTAFIILSLQCFDMYNKYQRKIHALDII